MIRQGPTHARAWVPPDAEGLAERVQRLIVKCGTRRKAIVALGVGDATFENARGCGRMRRDTYERVLDALEKAEAS